MDGRTIEAEFVRIQGSDVILRMGRTEHTVPLERLAPESRSRAEALQSSLPVTEQGNANQANPIGPVSEQEMMAIRKVLEESASWRTRLARAGAIEPIDQRSAHFALVRMLKLENNLTTLATPSDAGGIDALVSATGLSRTVAQRAVKLRQDIINGDQAKIRSELKVDAGANERNEAGRRSRNAPDPGDADEKLFKMELDLDKLYESSARKIRRDIATAEKALKSKRSATFRSDDEISRLSGNLDDLKASLDRMFEAFYGFQRGGLLAVPALASVEGPVGDLMREIHAQRTEVEKFLFEGQLNAEASEKEEGMIGGYSVYSANLGVVLDISGSMTSHIDPLKKEIEKSFPDALYREITGCSLRLSATDRHVVTSRMGTMDVIEELILVRRVDTIYWFCDLQDEQTVAALRYLRFLLKSCDVAFHVKSVGKSPSPLLAPLITEF
jgi:hypothetical protein